VHFFAIDREIGARRQQRQQGRAKHTMSDAAVSNVKPTASWQGHLLTGDGANAEMFRTAIIPSRHDVRAIWAMGAFGCSTRSTRFKPAFMEKKRKRFVNDDDDVMPETMQLNLVEALYLMEKGRLAVNFEGRALALEEARQEFQRRYTTDVLGFATRFGAYKTFREAGWVPKTGTQYGSNLVLYATDPDRCHSKFCVTLRSPASAPLSATGLMRLMRVAEQTRKRAVLCDDQVNCMQFKRWVLKQDKDPEQQQKQQQQREKQREKQKEKEAKRRKVDEPTEPANAAAVDAESAEGS